MVKRGSSRSKVNKMRAGGLPVLYQKPVMDGVLGMVGKLGGTAFRKGKELWGKHGDKITTFGLSVIDQLLTPGPTGALQRAPLKGQQVDAGGTTAITETKYISVMGKEKAPDFYRAARRLDFITNNNWRIESAVQRQQVTDMTQINTLSTAETFNYNNAIFNGNPSSYSTTNQGIMGTMLTLLPSSATVPSYMYFKSCYSNLMMTNLTNIGIIVDIYEVAAKTDIPVGNLLNSLDSYSPTVAWANGLTALPTVFGTQPTTAFAAAGGYQILGSTPYQSQLFNNYWEVMAKLSINLKTGASHTHTSEYNLNRRVDGFRFTQAPVMQGITRNIMLVVRGLPARNGVDNSVVVGPSGIMFTQELRYTAYAVDGSSRQIYYADTIANAVGDAVNSPSDVDVQSENVDPSI